jgi:AraC-like DNA-binding protein
MKNEILFTTEAIDAQWRTEYCRDFFASKIELTPVCKGGLYGNTHIKTVDNILIFKSIFNSKKYRRTKKIIQQSSTDTYLLCLMLSGRRYHSDGVSKNIVVEEGDILFLDLNLVTEGIAVSGQDIHLHLPGEIVNKFLKNRKINKSILLKSHWPVTRVLSDYILTIFGVMLDLSCEENNIILETVVSLLFGGARDEKKPIVYSNESSISNIILKDSVCNFIDLNIRNPELNIETIIQRFRVSRAHLYRAFEEEGGVMAVIRKKRLILAYEEISNHTSQLSMTQIAFEYGFTGCNHFNRAFKKYYNICPSEIKFEVSSMTE